MLPPLKPGAALAQPDGPVLETGRLKLRRWRGDDVAPNTAMLSDPGTARFITADGCPKGCGAAKDLSVTSIRLASGPALP